MSSVQSLREFISERLTAAAEEIFTQFEKTIVQYEKEIDRQRKLLDITWKPQIKLHRTDLQHFICKEEDDGPDQQLYNQERNSSQDQKKPEPPQIKEELEVYQLVLKQETDIVMVTPTSDKSLHGEAEPNMEQIFYQNSLVAVGQDQEETNHQDSESKKNKEPELKKKNNSNRSDSNNVNKSTVSESRRNTDTKKQSIPQQIRTDRPYTCKICQKKFVQKYSLLVHMRTHTGEKPYPCTLCHKTFTQKANLICHTRTHTGEKPYSCRYCGNNFTQYHHMTDHMRIHTGEKPFSCQICGKRFSRLFSLNFHHRKPCM